MLRPVKMKQLVITLLAQDIDMVIKFLGRNGRMQFSHTALPPSATGEERTQPAKTSEERPPYLVALENLRKAADFLGVEVPPEPFRATEPPSDADIRLSFAVTGEIEKLEHETYEAELKQDRLENTIAALSEFSGVKSPIASLKDLAFLSLRVGKIEPSKQEALKQNLGNRAVVIPLGEDSSDILAVSSKKGRFALDSELSKQDFSPVALPEDINGTPDDTLREFRAELLETQARLGRIEAEKKSFAAKHGDSIRTLYASCLMAKIMDEVKSRFAATPSAFQLKGWVEAPEARPLAREISRLTDGRAAVRAFDPYEVADIASGEEKIPVALKHGTFAKVFQPLVLSYGAPLYGSIDPTPITAFFFALLFAIMFGDVGQGAVLFLLGLMFGSRWGMEKFPGMKPYAKPLKVIGPLSMVSGLLYGAVFSNETLLEKPTAAVTGFLADTGLGRALGITETGRILDLMPAKDNIDKIFMFFGFTVAIGIVLNSIGLILFVMNSLTMRRYEKAVFSRNGIAGICFFWYAVSIGVRAIVQRDAFVFTSVDMAGLIVPIFFIVTGPLIWNIATAKRPLFPEGVFAFCMEGIVDILETLSGYISNTVSFLRVGAFALSHAVLSFIIFTMADKVSHAMFGGLWQTVIFVFGNTIIILLEAMIVAIQVVRLQYYEFFSKFFTELGTEFKPFRFNKTALK